jgi:hypothetical protein
LTIELLKKFDFDHQTQKSSIFDHPTTKTVHFWPYDSFRGGFADVDAKSPCWVKWAHMSAPSLSSPSPLSAACRCLSHLTGAATLPLHLPYASCRPAPATPLLPPRFISTKHPWPPTKYVELAPAISIKKSPPDTPPPLA